MTPEDRRRLAEAVREACLEAAKKGYAEASQSGLCHEGAVEASLDAIRMVDVEALLETLLQPKNPG